MNDVDDYNVSSSFNRNRERIATTVFFLASN